MQGTPGTLWIDQRNPKGDSPGQGSVNHNLKLNMVEKKSKEELHFMAPENDRSLGVTVGPQSSGWNPARPLCVCHLCLLSNYTGSKDAGMAPHSLKYFPPAFPEVSSSCARPVEAFAPARFATPILPGLTEVLHLWTPLSPARCCSGGRGGARWGQEAQGHHEKVDCATTSLRFPREPSPSSALGPVGRALIGAADGPGSRNLRPRGS